MFVHQDNQGAILLEKNGGSSCRDKSRHINIRYFFIKDIFQREKITVTHCPTECMIAVYFTKPLLGKLFTVMRDAIMGITPYPCKERAEGKICKGTEYKDNKPSTSNREDDQVSGHGAVPSTTPDTN